MTNQEIFDKVARHLLTQKVKSVGVDGACLYRGPNGAKCAIGCLIPDEVYSSDIEGASIMNLKFGGSDPKSEAARLLFRKMFDPEQVGFLSHVQNVHDDFHPDQWYDALHSLAKRFDLEFKHESYIS